MMTDHNAKLAFDLASAWLTFEPEAKSELNGDEDMVVDDEEAGSRLTHFDALMGDLRYSLLRRAWFEKQSAVDDDIFELIFVQWVCKLMGGS